ncbi:MAG: cytochrome c [Bacteroidetes bacterium]|nr:cytochrome c [Bacteroidota bacterium]
MKLREKSVIVMKKCLNFPIVFGIKFFVILMVILVAGCTLTKEAKDRKEHISNSGQKLWEQNCSRCHNSPSPASFSDAEWDVVGSHMRVRAYLTGKEADAIIKFLKSIN